MIYLLVYHGMPDCLKHIKPTIVAPNLTLLQSWFWKKFKRNDHKQQLFVAHSNTVQR